MKTPRDYILALITLFLSWLGYKFFDEATNLLESPTTATSPIQGIIGIAGIVAGAIIATYLLYRVWNWWKTFAPLIRGVAISRSPEELPSFSKLFSGVRTRVIVLAMDAGISTKKNYPVFRGLLDKGIVMQFFLIDPNSTLLDAIGKAWPIADARQSLKDSLDKLCEIKKGLSDRNRPNLKITFFDLLPIHSMVIVDPEGLNPKMQITGYQYNSHEWLSLIFSKNDQPTLYERYWQSYLFVESHKTRDHDCDKTVALF